MIRYLPNLLSALRLLAAPLTAWLILNSHDSLALVIFVGAGLSDGLDGFVARHWHVTSDLGARLDPAADKFLVLLCISALYAVGATPLWLLALVIGRDGAIVGAWLLIKWLTLPMPAEPLLLGKASTMVQILYMSAVLLLLAFDLDAPRLAGAAAWACGFFTMLSTFAYARAFLRGVIAGRPMQL